MTAENLFRTVFEMQPRDAASSGSQTVTREEKVMRSVKFDRSANFSEEKRRLFWTDGLER